MAQIDNIVQVNISRQTAQIEITAFDIPLILVEMTAQTEQTFTDRVRTYTSIEGVADDLGVNHKGYTIAAKLLGGDIKPATFKIGKKKTTETYVEALEAVKDIDDTWYALLTDTHTDANILAIANAVQPTRKVYFFSTSSQLAYEQSQDVVYTATVQYTLAGATTNDTISVVIAGERYEASYSTGAWGDFAYVGVGTGTFTGDFSINGVTGLLTITNEDVNYVVSSARATLGGVVTNVAASDISVTDPVGMDIGQRLHEMGLDRSTPLFSNTADSEFPEAAWVGTQIVEVPGSNTWEFKELTGVTVSRLTDTQITTLENRGYNYYIPIKNVNVTRRGKVAQGEWIDVMILVDWIHARMQEQIFFRFVNSRKIPFTDAGATIIENEIRSVLDQATINGGIDGYTVQAPRVLSIPEMQRNERTMGDFTFDARLAGAVSKAIIRGVVHA